ncbi:SGNH/GDSL hydrolase family protein [Mesobacterium pallidum]|uniref:SGNH/GDSL hydrolase family protein n=1 Tax=Mesobacterium pallidum TaxID=2872037 RepID=UPI001EE392A5|nr:GDSL-type esterase/lipase family protein [Mesobacterium pallidum]
MTRRLWKALTGAAMLLLASLGTALPGTPAFAQDCAVPALRPQNLPMIAQRQARSEETLRAGNYQVLAVGDSIVRRWPPRLLSQALGGRVTNAAVGGDGISDVLDRLNRLGEVPGAAGVTRVFLGAASNDLRRGAEPCEVLTGTRQAVARLKQLFPNADIVVSGLLPRKGGTRLGQAKDEMNRLLARNADEIGYTFVPIGRQIRAQCPDLDNCRLFSRNDGAHPTPDAYVDISQEVREGL